MHRLLLFGIILLCTYACEPSIDDPANEWIIIPSGFPEVVFPEGNELSDSRWSLGKKLFYDPALSKDSTISCASCHKPELAFSDDRQFSIGVGERLGTRNAPSLANVAYHPYFTREGGVPSLEQQVLVPVQEHNEFGFNIVLISERLQENKSYVEMAKEAYGQDINPYVITRALALFERTLISGNSPFDQFVQGDLTALTIEEKEGMELFFSDKTNCSRCHAGINFTNYSFQNNGLYKEYRDQGRMRLTNNPEDLALFKVPSLRNVEVTGPFMHDGTWSTLEEIVKHYNRGGQGHEHQSEWIKPLGLSDREVLAMVSFLEALTDEYFINNPKFR